LAYNQKKKKKEIRETSDVNDEHFKIRNLLTVYMPSVYLTSICRGRLVIVEQSNSN